MKKLSIKLFYRIPILLFLFSSCMTSKRIKSENEYDLISYSQTDLEGIYSNKIEGSHYKNFGLWNKLIRSFNEKLDTIETNNDMTVGVKFLNNTTLNISLFDNDSMLAEFNLKGKVDGEYFSVKRKYLLIPIPFFLFYYDTKNMIATSTNGNLVLLHASKNATMFLVFAGDSGGITSNEFLKIK